MNTEAGVMHGAAATGRASTADAVARDVERCKAGDPAAFRRLFERHAAGVRRHLALLLGPGEDVDDLVQIVFMNAFQSLKRFRGQSSFSTWLFRITVNIARQEIRHRGRRRRLRDAIDAAAAMRGHASADTPERSLATWEEIYGSLDRLSAKKRETFILYMYEGYSLEEIAQLLGSSTSTIGSRLQAARREILKILSSDRR